MTDQVAILEINDCNLRLNGATEPLTSSGFALFEDNWVAVGQEAESRFRLRPLHGNNTFWQLLNLDPLSNASGLIRHSADLVYHHLAHILASTDASQFLINYPAFYSDEQLSLLLGICDSLHKPVIGLVDSALLQASGHPDGNYVIVDQFLHHTLVNEINISNQQVNKNSYQIISHTGQQPLSDALVNTISDEFIRQTRFNPRHNAEDEQVLYNELRPWLEQLIAGESSLQIADNSITLGFNLLVEAGQRVLQPLFNSLEELAKLTPDSTLILTHNAAWIKHWNQSMAQATVLSNDHNSQQSRRYLDQLIDKSSTGGTLITEQLTVQQSKYGESSEQAITAPSESTTKHLQTQPTHILAGHHAHPIGTAELWLCADEAKITSSEPEQYLGKISIANGQQVIITPNDNCLLDGQPLTKSQQINADHSIGNEKVSYQFIKVMPHG